MINEMFNELWDQAFSKVMNPINMLETEDSIIVEIRAAGLSREEVKIDVEGNTLVIESAKKPNEDGHKYVRKEFIYDKINKRVILPLTADVSNVKAKMENGILTITVPKRKENVWGGSVKID